MAQHRNDDASDQGVGQDFEDYEQDCFRVNPPPFPPTDTVEVLHASYIINNRELAMSVIVSIFEEQKVIAVDCRGTPENIALLQVATNDGLCLIFDLLECPEIMNECGLRTLLEDMSIVKVIFDTDTCSTALYNQFQVTLFNVFDISSAYKVIKFQGTSLHPCLVPPVSINVISCTYGRGLLNVAPHVIRREASVNPRFWEKRPLTRRLCNYAARGALCLLPEVYCTMYAEIQPLMRSFFDAISKTKLNYPMTKQDKLELKMRQHLRAADKLKQALVNSCKNEVPTDDVMGEIVEEGLEDDKAEHGIGDGQDEYPVSCCTSITSLQPEDQVSSIPSCDTLQSDEQVPIAKSQPKPLYRDYKSKTRTCLSQEETEELEPDPQPFETLLHPIRVPRTPTRSAPRLRFCKSDRLHYGSNKPNDLPEVLSSPVKSSQHRTPLPQSPQKFPRSPRKNAVGRKVSTHSSSKKRITSPRKTMCDSKGRRLKLQLRPVSCSMTLARNKNLVDRDCKRRDPTKRKLDAKKSKYDYSSHVQDVYPDEPRPKKSRSVGLKCNGTNLRSNSRTSRDSMESIISQCQNRDKQSSEIVRGQNVDDVGSMRLSDNGHRMCTAPDIPDEQGIESIINRSLVSERPSSKASFTVEDFDKKHDEQNADKVPSLVLATRRNRTNRVDQLNSKSGETDGESSVQLAVFSANDDDDDYV